jgi:glycosyltransferase involved in cell wall biosynthesis
MLNDIVGIVIPNLNKREFIEECIRSLRRQKYDKWECIVVDGGSSDGSLEIIEKHADNDTRIHISVRPDLSMYESWNYGLSVLDCEYYSILTSDDYWSADWLSRGIASLKADDGIKSVACRPILVDVDGSRLGTHRNTRLFEDIIGDTSHHSGRGYIVSKKIAAACNYILGSAYVTAHSLIIHHSIIDDCLFDPQYDIVADREWYISVSTAGDVLYIPEGLAFFRCYKGQATSDSVRDPEDIGRQAHEIRYENRASVRELIGVSEQRMELIDEKVANYGSYRRLVSSISTCVSNLELPVAQVWLLFANHLTLFMKDVLYYLFTSERWLDRKGKELIRSMVL